MRWSGARPKIWLPLAPGAEHKLWLSLSVPGYALGPSGIAVTVNGQKIGQIKKEGRQRCEFTIPVSVVGSNSVAALELAVTPWKPSERNKGSHDERSLGVSVRQVELIREGAENVPAQSAKIGVVVVPEKLRPLKRSVGKGQTFFLQGMADDHETIARILPIENADPLDGRYSTKTDDGVLWFDVKEGRIWKED
jgi:hypothetical protein